MNRSTISYFYYPTVIGAAIATHVLLGMSGGSIAAATYAPVIIAGLCVLLLEHFIPERPAWRPSEFDLKVDATYMASVQALLTKGLGFLAGYALISGLDDDSPRMTFWPHHWPIVGQAVLMVLVVDFLRYWLHRASHHFDSLWRFHSVHHSPDILYSLNVGRFHPVERILQYCLDTLPFLILRVAPEVMAAYFVIFAVNGFFQHCNARVRYGWLNNLVGSAQTHRWHHARDPRTSACNFGNTIILWDVLFRTWYLPRDEQVEKLGLTDRAYPKDWWGQSRKPFEHRGPARPLRERLINRLTSIRLRLVRRIHCARLALMADDPASAQHKALKRILHKNRRSTFGIQHGFGTIDRYHAYARQVPVSDSDRLKQWVDYQVERDPRALTYHPPVCYLRTTGTTGSPKDIPLTDAHLADLRKVQRTAVAYQHRISPQAFEGDILAITSPGTEGCLANGIPFGAAWGVLGASVPKLLRSKFVLPSCALDIADHHVKNLLILRLALARRDITYMGAANPATFLTLMDLFRANTRFFLKDLRQGTFFLADQIAPEIWNQISPLLTPCPERAQEIARLRVTQERLRLADLWPDMRLLVTRTCASAGVAAKALARELPLSARLLELGYIASEFRGTITLGRRSGTGLPLLDLYFYEFVERSKWDNGQPEFLTLDQIRKGVDYYILVTTPSGLYRYFINDLVRVTGFLQKVPLFRFLQKGKGVTKIAGEKLYESQVLAAVERGQREGQFKSVALDYRRNVEFDLNHCVVGGQS